MKKLYINPNAMLFVMSTNDIVTTSQTLSVADDIINDSFGGAANGYERVF